MVWFIVQFKELYDVCYGTVWYVMMLYTVYCMLYNMLLCVWYRVNIVLQYVPYGTVGTVYSMYLLCSTLTTWGRCDLTRRSVNSDVWASCLLTKSSYQNRQQPKKKNPDQSAHSPNYYFFLILSGCAKMCFRVNGVTQWLKWGKKWGLHDKGKWYFN